jgi:ketosteroid isomerase-like protein
MMAALLAVSAACAPAAQQGQTDEDYTAIEAARNEFSAGMNAGDMAKVAGIYADDAVLMPPNAPAVRGTLAIKDMLAAFPPVGDFKVVAGEKGLGRTGDVGNTPELMPPGAA